MATGQLSDVVHHLRRAALLPDGGGMTDGQLLERFLTRRDEAAFEALVRRHGPMVWGVCRRLLHNLHDAEDAFQATFLVLTRKANSITQRESVGGWLYGTAYRAALEAKAARRRSRERQVTAMPEPEAVVEADVWRDLRALLDQELKRLPDKYREAVVLCDLEGKTRKEAARRLGVPEGTLSGRLTTARRMLAKRLTRQGLTLSGVALAAALSQGATSACLPKSLVVSTVKAAAAVAAAPAAAAGVISAKVAALTEGVLKAMLLTKLKMATAVLLPLVVLAAGVITAGTGLHAQQTTSVERAKGGKADEPKAAAPGAKEPEGPRVLKTSEEVRSVACSPDGKLIASVTWDWDDQSKKPKASAVKLWDMETRNVKMTLAEQKTEGETLLHFRNVIFSGDGKIVAASAEGLRDATKPAGEIKLWDAQTGALVQTLSHDFHLTCVAFSPDGKAVAGGSLDKVVKVWDAEKGTLQRTLEMEKRAVWSVAFSPDGKTLAVGGGESPKDEGEVTLWDLKTGKRKKKYADVAMGNVFSVAFSPDGKKVAAGGLDATVRVWELDTGKEKLLNGHESGIRHVAFSPDSKTLATAGIDKTVRLWDVEAEKEKETFKGHEEQVWSVSFSPDGQTLASGSADKTIRLWRLPKQPVEKK